MGWLFTGQSLQELTQELTQDSLGFHLVKGAAECELYSVVRVKRGDRVIKAMMVFLLEPDSRGWGYKTMDESMGPYYFNCPRKLLDMLDPPVNELAATWRARVRGEVAAAA